MPNIENPLPNSNPAEPANALAQKRKTFAAGVARYEFGGSYAPPDDAGFVDRRPGEIAIIRAARGLAT